MKILSEKKKARNARREMNKGFWIREPYVDKSPGFKYCGCEQRISMNKETCKACTPATV